MTATKNFPTAESALSYRARHDARVKELYRKTVPTLRALYQVQLAEQGQQLISGGPVSKEEFIRELISREYLPALMSESNHAAYHQPGENWSACSWCKGEEES